MHTCVKAVRALEFAVIALAFAGCAPAPPPAAHEETGDAAPQITPVEGFAEINQVAGTARDDLWVGGRASGGTACAAGPATPAEGAAIAHWNGTAWTMTPVGAVGSIERIVVASRGDAWALALACDNSRGAILLHWDGTQWSEVARDPEWGPSCRACSNDDEHELIVRSSTDVWVMNSARGSEIGALSLRHWNGVTYEAISSPPLERFDFVRSFWADGTDSGWAASTGSLFRWSAGTWNTAVTLGTDERGLFTRVRADASGHVWLATLRGIRPWNGTSLEPALGGMEDPVYELASDGTGPLWAYTSSCITTACSTNVNPLSSTYGAMMCSSECAASLLRWDGTAYSRWSVSSTNANSLFITSDGHAWIAGSGGIASAP